MFAREKQYDEKAPTLEHDELSLETTNTEAKLFNVRQTIMTAVALLNLYQIINHLFKLISLPNVSTVASVIPNFPFAKPLHLGDYSFKYFVEKAAAIYNANPDCVSFPMDNPCNMFLGATHLDVFDIPFRAINNGCIPFAQDVCVDILNESSEFFKKGILPELVFSAFVLLTIGFYFSEILASQKSSYRLVPTFFNNNKKVEEVTEEDKLKTGPALV